MNNTRRGFLFGLGAVLVTAPSIVRACNIMPIKNYDIFHKVTLEGFDLLGNPITEVIPVKETLASGLDMSFYKDRCAILEPTFKEVRAITWSQMLGKDYIDHVVPVSPEVDHWRDRGAICQREYIDKPSNATYCHFIPNATYSHYTPSKTMTDWN